MSKGKSGDPGNIGSARIEGPSEVVAGEYATYRITFRAGFHGVDDSGEIRLSWRWASDSGLPQFDDLGAPNYCSVETAGDVIPIVRYDGKGNVRPWGKTIVVIFTGGYLTEDDEVTIVLGDTGGGSPGWRVQTFRESQFRFRLFTDRHATYQFDEIDGLSPISIIPGEPVRKIAVAPTAVGVAEPFTVRIKNEDRWGNPVGEADTEEHPGFPEPGIYRPSFGGVESNPVVIEDGATGRWWADLHGQSTETIGSGTVEEYFAFARDRAFLDAASHQGNDFQVTDSFWERLQGVTTGFYEPGRFVTFPGYEYSPNTALGGDHNVIFKNEGPDAVVSRSCRALIPKGEASFDDSPAIENLYANLSGREALVWAHVGGRFADTERDSGQDMFAGVEIHSAWGTFEWLLLEALERGDRVAVFANSDGHKGRPGASYPGASMFGSYGGLTCILADSLDRPALWEAIGSRHIYGTTGARICLDVRTSGGNIMGDVARISADESLTVKVSGTAPIESIKAFAAGQVISQWRPEVEPGTRLKVTWEGAEVRGRGRKVIFDGDLSVEGNSIESFVPVNFHNPDRPLEMVSPQRLEWQCITTGGAAGAILILGGGAAGSLVVSTAQGDFDADLASMGPEGASVELGGVGKRIRARWLPAGAAPRDAELTVDLSSLPSGETPVHVRVIQEDGHMAWSSPVYCVK